ncbi:hypothetical protein ACIP4S_13170 [Streptomyces chartreusis]|uniref:hypothetical protein n=1 Tax=Streptomyces chartreusis TaxID=1969 RepID=UPI0037F47B12
MPTGPEHYREAQRLLKQADGLNPHNAEARETMGVLADLAQGHALLALTAATARPGEYFGDEGIARDQRAWSQAIRPAIAEAPEDGDV